MPELHRQAFRAAGTKRPVIAAAAPSGATARLRPGSSPANRGWRILRVTSAPVSGPRRNPSQSLLGTRRPECKSRARIAPNAGWTTRRCRGSAGFSVISVFLLVFDHLADTAPVLLLPEIAEEIGVDCPSLASGSANWPCRAIDSSAVSSPPGKEHRRSSGSLRSTTFGVNAICRPPEIVRLLKCSLRTEELRASCLVHRLSTLLPCLRRRDRRWRRRRIADASRCSG